MELAASMALGHLCMNLVMESPGSRWKVPTRFCPSVTAMLLALFHLVPLGSTTSMKPWNLTFISGSRMFWKGIKISWSFFVLN